MIGSVSDGTIAALEGTLEDGEQILGALSSMSAALVLTDRRLAIVRQGWRHRPQTGIRTWALDRAFWIQAAPRGAAGALIVKRERGATSFFVSEREWPDAQLLVTEARRLSARSAH
jgi:hypothetical protein